MAEDPRHCAPRGQRPDAEDLLRAGAKCSARKFGVPSSLQATTSPSMTAWLQGRGQHCIANARGAARELGNRCSRKRRPHHPPCGAGTGSRRISLVTPRLASRWSDTQ